MKKAHRRVLGHALLLDADLWGSGVHSGGSLNIGQIDQIRNLSKLISGYWSKYAYRNGYGAVRSLKKI